MDLNDFYAGLSFGPQGDIPYDYRRVKEPKPPTRTPGSRPTKSMSDRLTMADALVGTDELADLFLEVVLDAEIDALAHQCADKPTDCRSRNGHEE